MDATQTIPRSDDGLVARVTALLTAVVPPLAAAAVTAILLTEVSERYAPGDYVRRLLAPEGALYVRAVPAATVYLFFWTALSTLFHLLRIGRDQVVLRGLRSQALDEELLYQATGSAGLFGRLARPLLSASGTIDPNHDVFRHQAEIEAGRSAGRYSLLRLFVWAMPILGFIGTVIGIGVAVGEFSGFLSGDIEDLERVKHELSKVSTGLSFAFDTTLLGLVCSLFGMMLVSAAQSREENLHSDAEGFGLELVTAVAGAGAAGAPSGLAELDATTRAAAGAGTAADRLTHLITATVDRLQREVGGLRESIDHVSGTLGSQHLEAALSQLVQLTEAQATSARQLAPLPDVVAQVRALVTAQTEGARALASLDGMPAVLERLTASQARAVDQLAGVAGVAASLGQVVESQQRAATALESLQAIPQQVAALVRAHEDVVRKLEVVADVPRGIQQAVDAHARTVARLDSFTAVLGRLEAALDRSSQVLDSLSSPLEFRLVAGAARETRG